MRTLNKLSVAVVLGLLLGGCGVTDLGGEDVTRQLEQDFGGPSALMDFFESHTEEEIREALTAYGVGYVTHGNVTAAVISDCPKFFPSSDRSKWHNFDGEYYFIDSVGRPSRAYKDLPRIAAAPRLDSCQTSVGQWGDAENPSNDYDGGHLIGSQLGGWGGRANLVPQDANFNRGNWVQLENKMAKCGSLPSGRLRYSIGANYPNSTALIPNNMTMEFTNQSTGSAVSMSFSNVDGGGSNGTNERTRGVNWLSSQGCN
ncbi:DNA/RNA non-specific endonuclease [Corallococcus sp. bb12-1]|uniref:DNA/RNA non-specific endonuclease n=1 Tax=Corallococcus sp. bb12-1 TaxID=2996784 RepID=UPI00226E2CE8|nr:DNA/RNA non-specific endonuclease [Corallococcus sp. bb12-1]MCY1040044.1 DNA/RNA non-specific endonuclease [Corallococcus sp. bb12-1]